jgi:hypothetical protein
MQKKLKLYSYGNGAEGNIETTEIQVKDINIFETRIISS